MVPFTYDCVPDDLGTILFTPVCHWLTTCRFAQLSVELAAVKMAYCHISYAFYMTFHSLQKETQMQPIKLIIDPLRNGSRNNDNSQG